jgi:hypothetical protein
MIPNERVGSDIEEVTIPVWALFLDKVPVEFIPGIDDLGDDSLEKIIEHGSRSAPLALDILEKRKLRRRENIEAGRVRYVFFAQAPNPDYSTWYCTPRPPKDVKKSIKENKNTGRITMASHKTDAIYLAEAIFSHSDDAATIVVHDRDGNLERYIDILPNECEHDWMYVPTGDDVCRKCRLAV